MKLKLTDAVTTICQQYFCSVCGPVESLFTTQFLTQLFRTFNRIYITVYRNSGTNAKSYGQLWTTFLQTTKADIYTTALSTQIRMCIL